MKVVLSAEALGDLESIGDYIARDNPERARSFVQELIASARQIGDVPAGYPLVARYAACGVRRKVHGNYLIFYRIEIDGITIVHILHGARDYDALLFPD